jgi:hypothetical protein
MTRSLRPPSGDREAPRLLPALVNDLAHRDPVLARLHVDPRAAAIRSVPVHVPARVEARRALRADGVQDARLGLSTIVHARRLDALERPHEHRAKDRRDGLHPAPAFDRMPRDAAAAGQAGVHRTMNPLVALPLLLAPVAFPTRLGNTFEVEPRTLSWEEVSPAYFDFAWQVPEKRRARGRDLVAELRALLARRFELSSQDTDLPPCRSFGDVAAALRDLDDARRRVWLDRAAREAPELFGPSTVQGVCLRELFLDDELGGSGWDPDDDSSADGLYLIEPWRLGEEGGRWTDLGEPLVEQGAALVWSDLATFKAIENDYVRYHDHVGARYEAIRPVAGSHGRGLDAEGRAFSVLSVYSRADLPFPFTDYECSVHFLNRVASTGDVVTDVYSTSGDFHWIAGRDVFLDVVDSAGRHVATLAIRLYGFDLDGVPDGSSHRRAALRGSLGNLKRDAERRYRELGLDRAPLALARPPAVPEFRAVGRTDDR